MFTEPIALTGNSTGGTNDSWSMSRTSVNGQSSTWVCTNPTSGYRGSLVIRHTKSKPRGSSYDIIRSNCLLTLEKYNSTNELWDKAVASFTLTSPGASGGPLAASDVDDAWCLLKSFLVSGNMAPFLRGEV